MKVGMMAPIPGRMPRKKPSTLPRAMGAAEAFQSARVGRSPLMRVSNTSWVTPRSILRSTSLTPNRPMMMGTRPSPSPSVTLPKVKRGVARMGSSPTVPRSMPSRAMATARSFDPAVR